VTDPLDRVDRGLQLLYALLIVAGALVLHARARVRRAQALHAGERLAAAVAGVAEADARGAATA
jgi:hypothetical protein